MRAGAGWAALSPAQQRIVEASIEDAELAGVPLEGAAKERFLAIETELAQLGTDFSNHVLDATKAFSLVLRTPEEVDGIAPQPAGGGGAVRARPGRRAIPRWPPPRRSRGPGASPSSRRSTCRSWSTAAGATCASGCTGPS